MYRQASQITGMVATMPESHGNKRLEVSGEKSDSQVRDK